jgi:RimJ/RimL family protein N-acetyltransferase/protein tyrosine phosphatase (PTP) superfamily phosphohydrolase (DUF442 family)
MSTEEIYNYRKINDQIISGGQPTAEQLKSAAEEGLQTVINLATYDPQRSLEDEAGLVKSLGMTYHHIPVDWENPKESDFETFERVVGELDGSKTLIHCAANFRVTAFYGLYALKHLGWNEEQAEAFRAPIWEGSDYPIWEKFISQMRTKIKGQGVVVLREVIESDLPIFYEQQLDEEATQMASFPSRGLDAFMTHWAKILPNPNNRTRAIVFDGQVAGNIASFDLDGHREVGYWLGKEFWGRGIATRALATFLVQETVRPLYGYVAKHNVASKRVLEKCGFLPYGEEENEFILKLVD